MKLTPKVQTYLKLYYASSTLLLVTMIGLGCSNLWAQGVAGGTAGVVTALNIPKTDETSFVGENGNTEIFLPGKIRPAKTSGSPVNGSDRRIRNFVSVGTEKRAKETETRVTGPDDHSNDGDSVQVQETEKFHWRPALIQSGIFLGIQHGFRMTQKKTKAELGGPFFDDWAQSVKNIRGWRDGDGAFTNYFAHPMQGGLTGRIFVNNSDRAKKQEFGSSKQYWNSRFKAMVWSAVWSTQFEIGPISEASLGNVGMHKKNGYSTGAYVDFVITPTVGTGVLVAEDAIDKYILNNWLERKSGGKATVSIKLLRSVLTPTTAVANLLRWKVPWKRDFRAN